ncbi:MAG: hypothetical protein MUF51_03085, partial [Vicinamibacteria bacterium]|nr:hypothetical protein [Vicinamibacteria bacterium]
MKRVRRRILLTSALAVSALLLYIAAPRWTSIYLARKLSATFGRPTTVGQASYHFYPFELVAQDIRIGGPEFPDEPFLTVERVVLTPQIASFFQSRANLSQLRLEKPILHITAFLKGGDDLPSVSRRGEGGGLDIRRLTIVQGEFLLHHKRVPLELDLPNVTTQLSFGQGGTLTGRVLTGIGSIQVGSGPALNIGTDLDVTLDREALLVNSGRLRTARADLTYRGRIERRLPLGGLLQLAGQIDLAELDTHLWRTGFGIRGDADYQGTLEIVGPRLRLKGRMTGHSGEFDRVPVQKFAGGFSWDERGVRLDQLELATLGGSALLDIEIPPGSNPFRLKGTYRDVDSEGAIRAIFDLGALGVAASATGMVDLAWPKPRPRELSGRVVFDLSAGGDGRTPVNGQFVWHAEQGQQVIDRASLRSPTTEIAITGQIDPQRRIGWTLDGASADLAATDDLGLRLRRAMGAADAMLAGFTGRGRFRGACHGTLDLPEFTGRFSGDNVGLWGVTWGQAEWVGTATTTAVASHSLIVRRGGAEIWLDGLSETGDYGEQDALALKIKL